MRNSKFLSVYNRVVTTLLLILVVISNGTAQVFSILQNEEKIPENYMIDQYHIDLPKSNQIIQQDGLPFQFAIPVQPDRAIKLPAHEGKLEGSYHYLIEVSAGDAVAINFTMKGLVKASVDRVFVQSLNSKSVFGPFEPVENKYDLTPFPVFKSDKLLLEIIADKPLEMDELKLHRLGITYDEQLLLGSGECNVDINCDEGIPWQTVKNAVVRIMYNNGWLCSGTLINNTRNDSTPYFLTANHCIDNSYSAANMVFYFKYESLICDGPADEYPDLNQYTMAGAELKATKFDENGKLDFTLLELLKQIPNDYEPYFVGWNASTNPPANTTGIHHPKGDVKKICMDLDPPISGSFSPYDYGSFWHIQRWDVGVTEGGSSGSGLFNSDFQLIGTLTGGEADCDNPVNDFYQKFSVAYDKYSDSTEQLKYWLNPNNEDYTFWYGWPEEEVSMEKDYKIGPNPVEGSLTIYSPTLEGTTNVKIWSLSGKMLWEKSYHDVSRVLLVHVPARFKGLHVLEIETNDETFKKKMILY